MKLVHAVVSVLFMMASGFWGTAVAQGCCTTCIGTSECAMAGGATFTKRQISCVSGEVCVCNNVWRQCSSCIYGLSNQGQPVEQCHGTTATAPPPLTRVAHSVRTDQTGNMHFTASFLDFRDGPALPYMREWHAEDVAAAIPAGRVRVAQPQVPTVVDTHSLAQLGSQNPLLARVASLVLKRIQAGEPPPSSMLLPASLLHRAFDVDREGPAQWTDTPEQQAQQITRQRPPEATIGLDIAIRQEAQWLYITALPRDASTEAAIGPAPLVAFHQDRSHWRWIPARSKGLH